MHPGQHIDLLGPTLHAIGHLFGLLVLPALALFAIAVAVRGQRPNAAGPRDVAYTLQPALLTPAERAFMFALNAAIGGQYLLFPKVRIADVLKAPPKNIRALNAIAQKHFDFVLCEKGTFKPVGVIELDDQSHSAKSTIKRDAFVDAACTRAGLRIAHYPCKSTYTPEEIRARLGAVAGL